jgi:uncharacterized protein YaaR (DUF327 family)
VVGGKRTLNKKNSLNLSGVVNFVSRFVKIIKNTILNLEFIKSTNLNTKSTTQENFKLIF